jgi:hypothetical protein
MLDLQACDTVIADELVSIATDLGLMGDLPVAGKETAENVLSEINRYLDIATDHLDVVVDEARKLAQNKLWTMVWQFIEARDEEFVADIRRGDMCTAAH